MTLVVFVTISMYENILVLTSGGLGITTTTYIRKSLFTSSQGYAYYWIRKAYAPLHVSMDYQRLNYTIGERFDENIYAHTHSPDGTILEVQAEVLDCQGHVYIRETFNGRSIAEQALKTVRMFLEMIACPS